MSLSPTQFLVQDCPQAIKVGQDTWFSELPVEGRVVVMWANQTSVHHASQGMTPLLKEVPSKVDPLI